jgi:hypothetical protein
MTETFKNQLASVKKKFDETIQSTVAVRKDLSEKIETLTSHTSRYEDSWAGNWVDKTDLFHKNFNPSSREGMNVDENYIKKDLQKISGIDLNNIRDRITPLSKSFFDLKDFILSELSFIRDIDIYKNEIELLNQIEDFKWGMNPGEYARSRRPQLAFVQNPYELNKGLSTPPHITVGGEIIFAFSLLASYDNFEKLAHRLIRQLEIKSSTSAEAEAGAVFQQQALLAIIEKFHSVATQFRNRYDSRPTITINDEYDVQDLMNGLLRINFEDVRKEEYTPSYAGGSTRVDFLLKREKILIEVKKTRATLKDKDIGNQLIVDIAHYKSHPDCKQLICFVYDPDNFVANPRGLEDDLKRLSSEEMLVEVYIRP